MNLSTVFALFLFTTCSNLYLISALSYRLPKSVIPSFYSLKLITRIENNTFSGEVLIHVKVQDLQKSILLHSNELNIKSIHLDQRECKFDQHLKYEMIEIFRKQNEEISPGHHIIFIKYEGNLVKNNSNNNIGFFMGNFTLNDDPTSNLILVTDFEPTHARKAFPCFDEPSFKAVFQVTLIAPKEYKALSNMFEYEEFETSLGTVHKFSKTLKMSPYLLAFAVTNFDIGEAPVKYPNVRIFSPGANSSNSEEPLGFARKSIEFYEKYLNVSEKMGGKVDLIEYDRKLAAATENWGMITMNQGLLSPKWEIYDGYQIGVSISHEIAHSWFGNLVTNEWWDDIWLHEGLAVYMSIKAEQKLFSGNNAMDSFTTNYLDSVYTFDRNKPSNAIVQFLETPSEISQHFNEITYTKAAVIFRMIEMVISEECFKKVLQTYICRFAYKTINTEEFIKLVEGYDPHLRSFLETYLYQNRYPLIQVEEDKEMDYYVLTQKNCAYQKEANFTIFGYKWTIPINYVTDLNPSEPKLVWFDKDMEKLLIKKGNESWIKFNYQQTSFYRTVYSESMWAKFLASLSSETTKMDGNEANFLLREAISLYDANVISCKYPIEYFSKQSLSKPIKSNSALFIFILNMLNDNFNLEEPAAYTKFIDHIAKLWKDARVNEKKIQRFRDLYENPTNPNNKNNTNQQALAKMKNCALWINENL